MNLFAVNAAEVNGSIEVWSWYGDAALSVSGQGALSIGLTMSGDAQVVAAGHLDPSLRLIPNLAASQVQVASGGEAIFGRSIEGAASISLSASGDGTRWTFGESAAEIVFVLEGDASIVQPASGSFTVVIDSTMDGTVSTVRLIEGGAQVVVQSEFTPSFAKPFYLVADTRIELASIAYPYLVIDAPGAMADLAVDADGDARLGGKLNLEGEALIELFASGDVGQLHYIRGEGSAQVAITASMSQAGKPQIPTDYVEAPRARTFVIPRDARALSIERENRRI